MKRKCVTCGKTFEAKFRTITCSPKCSAVRAGLNYQKWMEKNHAKVRLYGVNYRKRIRED